MTADERKKQTEQILTSLGFVMSDDLPAIEEDDTVTLRSAREIAGRILVLAYLNCLAGDMELRGQVIVWLQNESLWEEASPEERTLFEKGEFTEAEDITIRSHTEAIWLLLWTIGLVDHIGLPGREVSARDIFVLLPDFLASPDDFFSAAKLRPLAEIMDQADLLFRLNWALRADLQSDARELVLDERIAYERYHAINWVIKIRPAWEGE